jgi:hypothetical protein
VLTYYGSSDSCQDLYKNPPQKEFCFVCVPLTVESIELYGNKYLVCPDCIIVVSSSLLLPILKTFKSCVYSEYIQNSKVYSNHIKAWTISNDLPSSVFFYNKVSIGIIWTKPKKLFTKKEIKWGCEPTSGVKMKVCDFIKTLQEEYNNG